MAEAGGYGDGSQEATSTTDQSEEISTQLIQELLSRAENQGLATEICRQLEIQIENQGLVTESLQTTGVHCLHNPVLPQNQINIPQPIVSVNQNAPIQIYVRSPPQPQNMSYTHLPCSANRSMCENQVPEVGYSAHSNRSPRPQLQICSVKSCKKMIYKKDMGSRTGTNNQRSTAPLMKLKALEHPPCFQIRTYAVNPSDERYLHPNQLKGTNCRNGILEMNIKDNRQYIEVPNCILMRTKQNKEDFQTEIKSFMATPDVKLTQVVESGNLANLNDTLEYYNNSENCKCNNRVKLCVESWNENGLLAREFTGIISTDEFKIEEITNLPTEGIPADGTRRDKVYLLLKNNSSVKPGDEIFLEHDASNGDEAWEIVIKVTETNMANELCIAFTAPPYRNPDITESKLIKVFIRNKYGMETNKVEMTYAPREQDCFRIAEKRKKPMKADNLKRFLKKRKLDKCLPGHTSSGGVLSNHPSSSSSSAPGCSYTSSSDSDPCFQNKDSQDIMLTNNILSQNQDIDRRSNGNKSNPTFPANFPQQPGGCDLNCLPTLPALCEPHATRIQGQALELPSLDLSDEFIEHFGLKNIPCDNSNTSASVGMQCQSTAQYFGEQILSDSRTATIQQSVYPNPPFADHTQTNMPNGCEPHLNSDISFNSTSQNQNSVSHTINLEEIFPNSVLATQAINPQSQDTRIDHSNLMSNPPSIPSVVEDIFKEHGPNFSDATDI